MSRQLGLPSDPAGSRQQALARSEEAPGNLQFTIQHSSYTTPLTNLAYLLESVKRQGVRFGSGEEKDALLIKLGVAVQRSPNGWVL